jgi:hypothetical protein
VSEKVVRGAGDLPPEAVCGPGTSTGNTITCVSIVHDGLDADTVEATANVQADPRMLRECLTGPNGVSIACSRYHSVAAGYTLELRWSPHGGEPAGEYCTTTARLDSGTAHTGIGHYCFDLHP